MTIIDIPVDECLSAFEDLDHLAVFGVINLQGKFKQHVNVVCPAIGSPVDWYS